MSQNLSTNMHYQAEYLSKDIIADRSLGASVKFEAASVESGVLEKVPVESEKAQVEPRAATVEPEVAPMSL